MGTVYTQDNVANVSNLPSNTRISIKAKTNSNALQKVTINSKDQELYTFTGSGERNAIIGQTETTVDSELKISFEYQADGQWEKSKLNSGGPYAIGSYNLLVVVAENGDDADYNDSILEFSWYTKKG